MTPREAYEWAVRAVDNNEALRDASAHYRHEVAVVRACSRYLYERGFRCSSRYGGDDWEQVRAETQSLFHPSTHDQLQRVEDVDGETLLDYMRWRLEPRNAPLLPRYKFGDEKLWGRKLQNYKRRVSSARSTLQDVRRMATEWQSYKVTRRIEVCEVLGFTDYADTYRQHNAAIDARIAELVAEAEQRLAKAERKLAEFGKVRARWIVERAPQVGRYRGFEVRVRGDYWQGNGHAFVSVGCKASFTEADSAQEIPDTSLEAIHALFECAHDAEYAGILEDPQLGEFAVYRSGAHSVLIDEYSAWLFGHSAQAKGDRVQIARVQRDGKDDLPAVLWLRDGEPWAVVAGNAVPEHYIIFEEVQSDD